uniref:Uncharacterized protein n=1 Tax=Syphacia muris TaxID=451379 RepID=A0A0N5AY20_9BILA
MHRFACLKALPSYISLSSKDLTTDLTMTISNFIVYSLSTAQIAGLMDGGQNNQPTLKRFSRYNQSLHCRPTSNGPLSGIDTFDPGSSHASFLTSVSSCSGPSSSSASSTIAESTSASLKSAIAPSTSLLSADSTALSFTDSLTGQQHLRHFSRRRLDQNDD